MTTRFHNLPNTLQDRTQDPQAQGSMTMPLCSKAVLNAALHRIEPAVPVRSTIVPTVDDSLLGALAVRLGVEGADAFSIWKGALGDIDAV